MSVAQLTQAQSDVLLESASTPQSIGDEEQLMLHEVQVSVPLAGAAVSSAWSQPLATPRVHSR